MFVLGIHVIDICIKMSIKMFFIHSKFTGIILTIFLWFTIEFIGFFFHESHCFVCFSVVDFLFLFLVQFTIFAQKNNYFSSIKIQICANSQFSIIILFQFFIYDDFYAHFWLTFDLIARYLCMNLMK